MNKQYPIPQSAAPGGSSISTPVSVPNGGTGDSTLTAHGVLLGEGTSAINASAAGNTGAPFLSGGASADGSYGALNLAGGANVVTGILPAANGGIANVSAADQGYFISTDLPITTTTAGQPISTAQQVRVCQFVLKQRQVVNRITITVASAGAGGSTVTVGIYDAAGTTKLIDSGTFDGSSNTTQTLVISPGVTLPAGVYWFAQSASTATALTAQAVSNSSTLAPMINNQTAKKCGFAANAATAGVLPPSLGAISATNYNMVAAVFEA